VRSGILGVTFAPGKAKNYAFATYSSGAPLGAICGNIFGGIVGQYAGWKWVFWILAIIAALVTVAGHFLIPLPAMHPTESEVKNAVDWIGGSIVTVALFILLFALTEGNIVGWSRPYIGAIIGVSAVLLTIFVFWQLHLENKTARRPLIKMSLFSNGRVVAAQLTMALFFTSFFNYLVFATFWFQDYQGHDKIQTMLRFLPTGPTGGESLSQRQQVWC
jgi:MFS family permease